MRSEELAEVDIKHPDLGLNPRDSTLVGLMGAGYSFGAMIAFPVSSWIADTMGRKLMIMIGDMIIIGAVLGQVFCYNARLYVLTRFILGIGSMFVIASCPVLLTELAHPRQRSFLVGGYASLFFVGSVVVAWVSFGSLHISSQWSWRIPTMLQLLPPALQLPLLFLVPESPRWLVSRGRHTEAKDILAHFHANGRMDDEVVTVQFAEICQAIELDQRTQETTWISWFRGPGNRRRLLLVVFSTIFGSWSGGGIITFYLSVALKQVGITEPAQQAGINGGLQIFNLCVALAAASLVEKLGRRILFISSSVIMLLAMIGFTVATEQFTREGQSAASKALVAMVFLFQFGSDVGYTPLTPMYTAEICPYHLRAKAMALHYFLMYAFSAAGQYANPVALQNLGWRYYLVYIVILVFEVGFTYFMFPETKGQTIEEVSSIFEK
ncbi:Lactose permease [Colletotrichum siamense]|nr:Lactose permease [Colletotrichum siamense]